MIDVLHWSAYKINVILIIMLKSNVLCDAAAAAEFPVEKQPIQDFTEYHIEHNVTEKDARTAFRLNEYDLLQKKIPAWCVHTPCNSTIIKYCLGNDMLNDHCCCDSRHGKEQFPWLPHSCYVGEICKPITGSCILYTEIRECCCDRAIARQLEAVFSSSKVLQLSQSLILCFLAFIILRI